MKAVYVKHQIANLIPISKIVTIHYFEFEKDFVSSGESHDFWEFVYIDKGEAIVTAGKQKFILKQGEGYFHKPNEFHALSANSVTALNVFIVSFVCNAKSMDFFKSKKIKVQQKWKGFITAIIEEGRKNLRPSLQQSGLKGPYSAGERGYRRSANDSDIFRTVFNFCSKKRNQRGGNKNFSHQGNHGKPSCLRNYKNYRRRALHPAFCDGYL